MLIIRPHQCLQQMLYREAVMWKRLTHANIVPFKGVTFSPLRIVSEWMPGGDLTGYICRSPQADRIGLVSPASVYLRSNALIFF